MEKIIRTNRGEISVLALLIIVGIIFLAMNYGGKIDLKNINLKGSTSSISQFFEKYWKSLSDETDNFISDVTDGESEYKGE